MACLRDFLLMAYKNAKLALWYSACMRAVSRSAVDLLASANADFDSVCKHDPKWRNVQAKPFREDTYR